MLALYDTIVALASAPRGAARAIVRVSGPDVATCLQRCFRSACDDSLPWQHVRHPAAFVGFLNLGDPWGESPCQLLFWPTERSYTRQPMAELHLPGSMPLAMAAQKAVCIAGARLAEPGEFTLRAVLAGRIDLVQAEAVLGIIDAATKHEFEIALRQLAGGLSRRLHALRESLLESLAHLEAGLDFTEEDIQFISRDQLRQTLLAARNEVEQLLRQMNQRAERPEQFRIALIGLPNAGKSSLLNAICGATASIVADIPGTTRDYVARRIEIEGVTCLLLDTAGVDAAAPTDPSAEVNLLAQASTALAKESAHLHVLCLDASRPLDGWEKSELARPHSARRLVVFTKIDLPRNSEYAGTAVHTSSTTGQGIAAVRSAIAAHYAEMASAETEAVSPTAIRCEEGLRLAHEALVRADAIVGDPMAEDLVAVELRAALDEIGRVTGAVCTDDILDRIFSRFCIGK